MHWPTRKNLPSDLTAAVTTALITIPDGMASAVLAGVSPLHGLYALMVGTPLAALVASSQFMYVANTGALAVATGDALAGRTGEDLVQALIVLTVLVGVFQLLIGGLRLGGLVRFVSNSVMTGFMTGIALLIILGQLGELTGYHSEYGNKVLQAVDLLLHPAQIDRTTLAVGLITIVVIVIVQRTRLSKFSMVIAISFASLLVYWQGLDVATVRDISPIPGGLPRPVLPQFRLVFGLIFPAIAVGIIGLVQSAGVSKSVPNPDGKYGDMSRDFFAQGVGNTASGLFRGMPIGGTMSETAVNVSAGAKSRWAGVFSGILILIIIALLAPVVEQFAMPAIAALLIVAGFEAIKFGRIADVWDTGLAPRAIMILTFVATLTMPVQYAVFLGVLISLIQYIYKASLDITVVQVIPTDDGGFEDKPAPHELEPGSVVILELHGNTFYAATHTLEQLLPDPTTTRGSAIILRLRGRTQVGSTFIDMLERYGTQVQGAGGLLLLSGVDEHVMMQLERTETIDLLGVEYVFPADARRRDSTLRAFDVAQAWVDAQAESKPPPPVWTSD